MFIHDLKNHFNSNLNASLANLAIIIKIKTLSKIIVVILVRLISLPIEAHIILYK